MSDNISKDGHTVIASGDSISRPVDVCISGMFTASVERAFGMVI